MQLRQKNHKTAQVRRGFRISPAPAFCGKRVMDGMIKQLVQSHLENFQCQGFCHVPGEVVPGINSSLSKKKISFIEEESLSWYNLYPLPLVLPRGSL